jgi:hypothetical protein
LNFLLGFTRTWKELCFMSLYDKKMRMGFLKQL